MGAFNALVENKDYFLEEWQECFGDDNLLKRYKAKQFIGIMMEDKVMTEFNINLYFALVEKMIAYDDGRVIVSLLDGSAVECTI